MNYTKLPLFLILVGIFLVKAPYIYAQNLSLDESPVEEKFQYVYAKSSDYEDYKMVKRWHFARLKRHVLDTISSLKTEIAGAESVIAGKNAAIDSLVAANAEVQTKFEAAVKEKDSLSLLGIQMQKSSYNTILWSVIAILAGGAVILFLLFKRSNAVTATTKSDLSELRLEFEAFRKRALEREEGIVRKYHNELNKYKVKAGKLS